MGKQKGLSFYRRKKKVNSAVLREIFEWFFGICTSAFIAIVLVYFMGVTTHVVGASMEPTLYNSQEVFVDRFRYILTSPKVGDVIVFLPNGNENAHYYVKRVVAVPGDEVLIENGTLYINGRESEFSNEKILEAGIADNQLTIEKGEYFCIGDNVNNSEDSRSANIGPVKESDILGKAWLALPCEEGKFGFVK